MVNKYIVTERAHFMCPNMFFGMFVQILGKYDKDKFLNCILHLSEAHPLLKSVIKYEENTTKLYYDITDRSQIEIVEKQEENTWREDYRKVGAKEWNAFKNGLLKLYVYPSKNHFKILFIAHHLLGDGRCVINLVNELVNMYVDGSKIDYREERLIESLEDLPEKSDLTGISKYIVNRVNKQWKKEKHLVTYKEYAEFVEKFSLKNPVGHCIVKGTNSKLVEMKSFSKANQITLNDLLMARLYIESGENKITIAADIRDFLKFYQEGACGNYASAMGIVCKGKSKDIVAKSREVHKQVKKFTENNRNLMLVLSCYLTMDRDLIDSAAISGLGGFTSKAGQFVGGTMFGYAKRDGLCITNLGILNNENIEDMIFIPPASPSVKNTIGILTLNGQLSLCSSHYENFIDKETVERQLQAMLT